nr:hypothetical protein [Tanacetum cinerariifolium]
MNEEDMFGVNDLDGDEVIMDVTTVTTAATTLQISKDELTWVQTLIEIKAAKPKVITTAATIVTAAGTRPKEKGIVMQEPSKTPSSKPIDSYQQPSQAKDKGKGKMVKPKKPLKRKDQIMIDEEFAKNLEAQMQSELEKEERLAGLKEEETNLEKGSDKVVEDSEKDEEGSSKRAGSTLEQEDVKRQRLEEVNEFAKLKRCLEIIPKDDDNVTIEATPLSSKSPTIVDYKINKEGKKSYFKIIRADARFKKTKPIDNINNILFQTLKTMFEHHVKDNIWRHQQGSVQVLHWKLFDSCGVYYVTTQNMVYYLLVEKMYPFTRNFLLQMWNDVRLQVDYEVEMAYDLLRLIKKQINEGYVPE